MVYASGYIEVDSEDKIVDIEETLKGSGIEVSGRHQDRIVFLIEREDSAETKRVLESLKEIEGVRNVYLAYFSLEGSDEP